MWSLRVAPVCVVLCGGGTGILRARHVCWTREQRKMLRLSGSALDKPYGRDEPACPFDVGIILLTKSP